jgi:glycerol-1-phosphate dehydrogenase [NAD(P)+]
VPDGGRALTVRRRIDLPRLLQVGEGCLGDIGALLLDHSFDLGRVYVGSGGGQSTGVACEIVERLRERGSEVVPGPQLDGRFEEAVSVGDEARRRGFATLIAVGGGRVIDTVKLAAARAGTELVSVPTSISHDGISSPVASLFARDGHRSSYAATTPAGIIVDITVIGSAPPRALRAGLGDLVSNLTAILDWQLAQRAGRERYDAYSAMIAETAARSVLDLPDLQSPQSHERLAKGLVMSGLAMAAAGTSRPCSGAEHLISHALDQLLGGQASMHGEQVALGSLVSAAAHGSPLLNTLIDLYARVGLPMHPAQLSIASQDMLGAVQAAPGTRPTRYTILSERDLSDRAVSELLDQAFGPTA